MGSAPLAMGKFEGIDRYTFRIGTEGIHCMFRDLDYAGGEEAQERVSVVASLQDLNALNAGTLAAIPISGPHDFTAVSVHKRICKVAPGIAQNFGFKEDVQADAPFRLIHGNIKLREDVLNSRLPPFVALSYCWHDPSWGTKGDPADPVMDATNFSWPVSKSMVRALLLERLSSHEGIWIDQCCINQDDPQEKSRTIGFMNLIYAQARVVVVVLEDVVIGQAESVVLENLMQKCGNRGSTNISTLHEDSSIYRVVSLALKIFSARWFTRAWCNHELLVSKNHIFLIGVSTLGHDRCRVLRVTLLFLNSLLNVVTSYGYTGAKDRHHSELMAQVQINRQRGFLHVIFNAFGLGGAYNLDEIDSDPSTSRSLKSLVETLKNLSKFGATVAADKLAITLNIAGSGLYYKGPERPEHECSLLLSVVALAAGDPAVLCCSGARFELPDHSNIFSWIQRPESLDFAGTAGRRGTHRRLDHMPDFTLKHVELDFFHVASTSDTSIRRASEPFLTRARWYIDGCIGMSKIDPMFQLGGTLENERETKIQVLACALECGPRWINEAAAGKTSADYPDSDLEVAIEIFLSDLDTERDFPELTEEYREMYEVLTDFLETLTLDYISPIGTPEWAPAWVSMGLRETDRLLFMCPVDGRQQFAAMIPTLLQHAEYTNCKRMFLLQSAPQKQGTWTVLGKSLVFSTDLGVLTPQHNRLMERQVIRT